MSGRPIQYKELLDALHHTQGNVWQVPGAEHITLRIEPSSSGYCAIWRHDLATNQWWDGSEWQTDTTYVHDIYRWKVEDAVHQVQPLLTAEKADAAKNTEWRKARAERAKSLAEVVDELLDPIREAVSA